MALEKVAIIPLQDIDGSCLPPHIIISLVSYSEVPGQPFTETPYTPASLTASPLCIWLSVLMRARLQSMAVRGPMVNRGTQDNGWIIKGSPVERIFLSLPPSKQPTFSLFFSHHSPFIMVHVIYFPPQ